MWTYKVLVIEDEIRCHELIKIATAPDRLMRLGCGEIFFDLVFVDRLAAAIGIIEQARKANEAEPDLIWLDLGLPDSRGLIGLERLLRYKIPVIIVTGNPDIFESIRGQEMGAVGWLRKPYDIDDLPLKLADAAARGRYFKKRPEVNSGSLRKNIQSLSRTKILAVVVLTLTVLGGLVGFVTEVIKFFAERSK